MCLSTGHADPYLVRESELVFVVDDGAGPVGYVLGTADPPALPDGSATGDFRHPDRVTPPRPHRPRGGTL